MRGMQEKRGEGPKKDERGTREDEKKDERGTKEDEKERKGMEWNGMKWNEMG